MDNNYIIGEIIINDDNKNKKIRIINSYEESYREHKWDDHKKEYENEKEIKDNCKIYINNNKIEFSYYYEFKNDGIYIIKYFFINNLTKINHMFYDCSLLTSINLSYFNTRNVTNMVGMFSKCTSLTSINLSNFNTRNVINISWMFYGCTSLKRINLSNCNTQNVINMSKIFSKCTSLTSVNLSSFNTQNVFNMSGMFNECSSLKVSIYLILIVKMLLICL